MIVFSLTTVRYFSPYSLAKFPNIVAYLRRIGDRPAYQRAMEKGDSGMELLLGPDSPSKSKFEEQ